MTRAQMLEAGLSPAAIGRRLKAGRIRALHRGVYLLGPVEPTRAREMAAVLAGGPRAVLSHSSAARLWEIHDGVGFDITVPGSRRRSRPGIRVHCVGTLEPDELTTVDGIPVTSPGRTLLDLAGMVGSRELELAMARAERSGLVTGPDLVALVRRHQGRPGIPMLRTLIRERSSPELTRSEAERRCLDLFRRARLPPPQTNVTVGPYELDLLWPHYDVAVEIDGRAYHASTPRFEGDRRKDTWLRARGIQVIRLTWRQITRDSLPTAVQVGQILALAQARRG